jgi:RimJ/RimL family protein N-acetyltransferase
MLSFARVVNAVDRRVGLSRQKTYLYKTTRPENWSAPEKSSGPVWELASEDRIGELGNVGMSDPIEAHSRLQRGDLCYMLSLDGRVAHYSWVQRSGGHLVREAGRSIEVAAGELWIYDCWTAAWARGKKLYPATLTHIIEEHFRAGYKTAWIYTTEENIASQNAIRRVGFDVVATFIAFRIGERFLPLGRTDPQLREL